MKNVNKDSVYKGIFKSWEDFSADVVKAFGEDVKVDYSYTSDEVILVNADGDMNKEEVLKQLSAYYDVEVYSVHVDGVDCVNVWIMSKDTF